MADTDYIFHISPYDTEKLLPQVSNMYDIVTRMQRAAKVVSL